MSSWFCVRPLSVVAVGLVLASCSAGGKQPGIQRSGQPIAERSGGPAAGAGDGAGDGDGDGDGAGLNYGQAWGYSPARAVTFHACADFDTAFIGVFTSPGGVAYRWS
ncbi:hypothetical protein [Paractinoplanes durhamensis]|uniref:hypothetical protein n=1 Tax=Paractinoplanes durhamensis TaxID=113563 RepID=UPI003644E16A